MHFQLSCYEIEGLFVLDDHSYVNPFFQVVDKSAQRSWLVNEFSFTSETKKFVEECYRQVEVADGSYKKAILQLTNIIFKKGQKYNVVTEQAHGPPGMYLMTWR